MADELRKKAIDKLLGPKSKQAKGYSPPGFYVKSRQTQIEKEKK